MDDLKESGGIISDPLPVNISSDLIESLLNVSGYYLSYEDILFFQFRPELKYHHSKVINDRCIVDMDENGQVKSLEVLWASHCNSAEIDGYLESLGFTRDIEQCFPL